jgi:hypothetical protein
MMATLIRQLTALALTSESVSLRRFFLAPQQSHEQTFKFSANGQKTDLVARHQAIFARPA